jgi:amino acid permease
MMSGEASHPRKNLKRAFKTIYFRFGFFFIGGALATGIVIPYNDPALIAILGTSSAGGTAASSPFVIAMQKYVLRGNANSLFSLDLLSHFLLKRREYIFPHFYLTS